MRRKATATGTDDQLSPELEKFIGGRVARRAIVETALEVEGAFSARQLHAAMRSRHPVGKATVYRTLRLLLENRFLRETVLRDGTRVYQRAEDPRSILWVCDDCSAVFALPADNELLLLRKLGQQAGLHPQTITVEVHSRCTKSAESGPRCQHPVGFQQ